MQSTRTRTVSLLLATSLSGIALLSAAPAQAAAQAVDMTEGNPKDDKTWVFTPRDITVKKGTAVAWTNKGKQPHTAAANDGSFDSGTMKSGARFEHVFNAPGEFPYSCTFHPGMNGLVRVTP
jgi:plastocyanin